MKCLPDITTTKKAHTTNTFKTLGTHHDAPPDDPLCSTPAPDCITCSPRSKLGRNRVDHCFDSAELPGRQFDHPRPLSPNTVNLAVLAMGQSDPDAVSFGLRIIRYCLGTTRSKVACKPIDDDRMT